MAIIQKKVLLVGSKGKKETLALFDSGATYSCLNPGVANGLGNIEPLPEPIEFGTAKNGDKLTAVKAIRLNFHIDDLRFSDEFMLIDDLSEELIIGTSTMQKWRMKLDFEHDEVILDPQVTKLRLL